MQTSLNKLRILVIEDNKGDYVLIEEYLQEELENPVVHHVETFSEAEKQLASGGEYDTILLDLSLPDHEGEPLVNDLLQIAGEIPVIVLTGYHNKTYGLNTLKLGVSDYLIKDELNPFLLEKSISYNIERNKINRNLKQSEQQYRELFDMSPQPMWVFEMETLRFLDVNKAAVDHYGYSREEFLNMTIRDIRPAEDLEQLDKVLERSGNKNNFYYKGNFRHIRKNGERMDVVIQSNIIEYNGAKAKLVLAEDITEKRKAEHVLQQSEQRFKSLVQDGSDLIAILDEEGTYKYVSPTSVAVLGIEPDDFVGTNAFSYIHKDDQARLQRSLENLASKKRVYIDPYRFKKSGGEWRWIETVATNLMDEPSIKGYVANSRDVTRQIRREAKLKELSMVASRTTDIVVITDQNGLTTWVNQAFEKLTGYTLDEIKGKKPGSLLQGEETNPETIARIGKAIKERRSAEEVILNYSKSGKKYWLDITIDPIFDEDGNCTHFVGIQRDVSRQIKREAQLNESLKRYDIVAKATSDTIWDLDLDNNLMMYNSNIYNMFGYSKTEVSNVHQWWQSKIHPDDKQHVNRYIESVLEEGTDRFQMEYRFKCADGSYKHIYDRAFLIKDDSGKPVRMIGAMQDVTTDVEEEQRLKLLESVITHTTESVVISEAKPSQLKGRRILYVNEAFTYMTGYSREEVVGRTLQFLNGPKTSKKERSRLREAINNFQPCEVEFINYKKSGEEFWINLSTVPVADKKGNYTHWISIGRDITHQKNKEKEIKSSLKEKETLLAEIHHRVKNNLAVISSLMQMQAMAIANEELGEHLMDSVLRIKSMAAIHEQLYQSSSFSKLPFAQSLQGLVENVVGTMKVNKTVDLAFDMDPVYLNINQGVPCSLIANEVLTNALKHGFRNRKKGKIEVKLSRNENQVVLTISDDGVGLPEDFSPDNKSMGMELIDLLTEQLAGDSRFDSNPTGGTTFELRFSKADVKGIGSAFIN